ncbi:hypothetical protein AB2B41_07110 [Marimonas sp. MJW-29]|uniref:Uncharacterized protein n=1 Tax=Sulfitobacter sediminis TaxID=3234186 RepID=A0ABV3RL00_9RHOB
MISTEFIAGLADIMGVERTELATVDRALAKRGMRRISRGRFRPDITLEEGLSIVLGWAGTRNLTLAADEVERLQKYALHVEEPTYEDNGVFEQIFGASQKKMAGETFQELLVQAARNLGAGQYEPRDLWVSIEKDGDVDISYRTGSRRVTLSFFYLGKIEFGSARQVQVKVRITGVVLKWIFDVTEGN